jgi:hypothetical protein
LGIRLPSPVIQLPARNVVVNAVAQKNPQYFPQMILTKNRNISYESQFFLLNISVSHLMPSITEMLHQLINKPIPLAKMIFMQLP